MLKKILCRADGNSKTGLGHMYRLFALVELYKEKYDLTFITREDSTLNVIPKTYNLKMIPEIDLLEEPNWLYKNYKPEEYLIILDGYQFSPEYQKSLKSHGFTIVYIDDLVKPYIYADIVINHSEGIDKKEYRCEPYTHIALGTKYAILRPTFLEETKTKRAIQKIDTAFVCFGGADMYDLSYKATQALLDLSFIKEVHVLIGGAYKHTDIFDLENKESSLKIHRNIGEKEIVAVMKQCNFAIAPASTTLYELCTVKMPILSGYFVENQIYIYKSLLEKGAIYGGGDFTTYTSNDFSKKIREINKGDNYSESISIQQELFDDKIKQRFLQLLEYPNISVRKATEGDMLKVYNWSNDPVVRENSYNSEPIKLEDHQRWFLSKIEEEKTSFFIILYNKVAAGMVRYDVKSTHAVLGVTIGSDFRGKKLASLFLIKSAEEYFKQYSLPIFAYIKKENIASVKSFEKAGYILYKEEKVGTVNSYVYKLEKN